MQLGKFLEFKIKKGGTIKYIVDQPNAKGIVFNELTPEDQAIFERLAYWGYNTDFISKLDLKKYMVQHDYVIKLKKPRVGNFNSDPLQKYGCYLFIREKVPLQFKGRTIYLRKGKITEQGIVYEILTPEDQKIFRYLVAQGDPPDTITFDQLCEYDIIPYFVVPKKPQKSVRRTVKKKTPQEPSSPQIPDKYKPIYLKLIARGVKPEEINLQILEDLYRQATRSGNIDDDYKNLFG